MNDNLIIKRLETIFKWLGYFMLASTVFILTLTIREFALTDLVTSDGVTPANTNIFYVMPQMINLIVYITQAFFVMLVSHVFSLISGDSKKNYYYGQRLMIVTCSGFTLHGFLSFGMWVYSMITMPSSINLPDPTKQLASVSYYVSALGQLMPVLYAITIFILYRHFVKMITFESEVV